MALILNIETATPVCSAGISRDGFVQAIRHSSEDRSHTTRLSVFIQEVLTDAGVRTAQLDAISVSMGPGSYTGLRIGASIAKGLAYGAGIPVIGIPTLLGLSQGFKNRVLAENPEDPGNLPVILCPMLDARRLEVYTATYDIQLNDVQPVIALILENDSFRELLDRNTVYFFGSGSAKASALIHHPNARWYADFECSAADQALPAEQAFQKGDFLDTAYFEPHYLKEFIASIPKNKVLGGAVQ